MPPEISFHSGQPYPLGLTIQGKSLNFSIVSTDATSVVLCLFEPGISQPFTEILLDPYQNRTGNVWHISVTGIKKGSLYAYRIDGPKTAKHHRFDVKNFLLDPYAKTVVGNEVWGKRKKNQPLLGVVDQLPFKWHDDRPLKRPLQETIIYEMHVRGFTMNKNSGVKNPGTYEGIIEKIPYLTDLGITAVELLPIHEFDETEIKFANPLSPQPLVNFWGYNSINFFSPKAGYAVSKAPGQQINEFKSLVKALHNAGLEIILDVVFNHTGEGDITGPTLSFRGIDNGIYYLLDSENNYANYSGCGNTVNCNHPVVREFIIDCLRYWVLEMHVDGFRFDLASIFSRGQNGQPLEIAPLVEQIAADPFLADTKIIAEAWDAAGLYQVGSFSTDSRWAEWNGRYRDDVRSFMCGHKNTVTALATRVAGSSDLFKESGRSPNNSVNFITSHDGFTMYDLVSYNSKVNTANGENNRDGENHNISWNSGKEGPTTSKEIQNLRFRRMRTMATILLLSQGTPMLLAGDEFCRTQKGNNNAYCQDNPLSWLDWSLAEKHKDMHRFFKKLIGLRKDHPVFHRTAFFTKTQKNKPADILWQGTHRGTEDWSAESRLLCLFLNGEAMNDINNFFIAFNAGSSTLDVELPSTQKQTYWHPIIDTAQLSPNDILDHRKAAPLSGTAISVQPMAAMVLIA
nr:glycogen debranching protein GlgX [Desulfobulbaceae bacterium]